MIFPFRRRRAASQGAEPVAPLSPPPAAPVIPMPAPRAATALAADPPPLEGVVAGLLAALQPYLPAPAPPLPAASVSVLGVTVRSAGLGGLRGFETLGSFAVRALKGIRVEAVVRFTLWGAEPGDVDAAIDALHGRLLAARDALWTAGVLRFTSEGGAIAERIPSLDGWRRIADYRALYEYRYQDSEDAESVIARIPIHSDLEVRDSLPRETTVVTDEIIRWDNEAAPVLTVRGPATICGLVLLDSLPAPLPGVGVTLLRTFDGASGAPTPVAALADFLAALADPSAPARHIQLTFGTLGDVLAAFTAIDEITLGDWNGDGLPDRYRIRTLAFDPVVALPSVADRLEIAYQAAAFDRVGVLYLRAARV